MQDEPKTLREVCKKCGVSRRAVQGYELCGMISPSGKNDRGHLLYNAETQLKIEQIKQYQSFGFKVKEIQGLFSMPSPELKRILISRRQALLRRASEVDAAIEGITRLINELDS